MLKILVNIAKKIPMEGYQYSSVQASCSIEGEVVNGQDAAGEADKLYQQAERAVDFQLKLSAEHVKKSGRPQSSHGTGSANDQVHSSGSHPQSASRPYTNRRRSPALITEGQIRYLEKLILDTNTSAQAIMDHYSVGSFQDLTCRDAAQIIDELKGRLTVK